MLGISSLLDGIFLSQRNAGPLNQLDFISSSACVIRRIVLVIGVSPFFGASGRPDYFYSFGNKCVESFGIAVYVAKYHLGISSKVLFHISVI